MPVKFDCFLFSCFVMFPIFISGKMPSCLAFECSSKKFERKKVFIKFPIQKRKRPEQLSGPQYGKCKDQCKHVWSGKDKICCSDHFHKDCFKRNFRSELKPNHSKKLSTDLVDGVIPTIFKHKVYDFINMDGTSMPPLKESASRKRTLENERVPVINNIVLKIN